MSEITLYKDDNGRKVYKVTTTYTVKTEEFVKVAEGEDPYDVWLDQGGLDYSKINQDCLNEGPHTEAYYAEAFVDGGGDVKYMGTVVPEYDEEYKDEIVDYVLDVLKWVATATLIIGFGLMSAGNTDGWYLQIAGGILWLIAAVMMKDRKAA